MRRMLAVAAVAAAFAAAPNAASATHYDRQCGGVVDIECRGTVCPMDCFGSDCLIWLDPFHSPFSAVCVPSLVAP